MVTVREYRLRESGPYVGERGDEVFRGSVAYRPRRRTEKRVYLLIESCRRATSRCVTTTLLSARIATEVRERSLCALSVIPVKLLLLSFFVLRGHLRHPAGDRFSEQEAAWRGECSARQEPKRFTCNSTNCRSSESHKCHESLRIYYI